MNAFNQPQPAILVPTDSIPTPIQDNRETWRKLVAQYTILASTLFERLAFYALMTTISITLQLPEPFHWNNRHSKSASYIFSGTSYVFTLIIAAITDAKLGRAKTIVIGFVWYLVGLTLVTITASGSTFLCHFDEKNHRNATVIGEEKCAPALLGTLIFTAIGAGAVKSNLAVFGAEQIQESRRSTRYFDKYAVAVNIGSMIATVVIPYMQAVPEHNYFIPYLVALSMLLFAALLFLIGWPFYINVKPYETVITKCIPVVFNALQSWYKVKKEERSLDRNSTPLREFNTSHSRTQIQASMGIHGQPSTLLDYAKAENRGKFLGRIVEDVKSLRSALLVFTLLIPFWVIYNQTSASFLSQGKHMSGSNLKYVVPWMSLGDSVTVIIGILILNILVYKYINAEHRPATITTKFMIGMCFACLSMCAAGIVEAFRQDECKKDSTDSNLSVYYQIPQSIFIGVSQLFGMVASYEYAYFAAPLSAQSLFMSLHFCSIGIASYIDTVYTNYFPNPYVDINFECQINHQLYWSFYGYFFILAGLQLIFMIVSIICYKKFRIVKLNPQQLARNLFIQ